VRFDRLHVGAPITKAVAELKANPKIGRAQSAAVDAVDDHGREGLRNTSSVLDTVCKSRRAVRSREVIARERYNPIHEVVAEHCSD
jgi:hypothetical protein